MTDTMREKIAQAIDPSVWEHRDECLTRREAWDSEIKVGWPDFTFEQWVNRGTGKSLKTADSVMALIEPVMEALEECRQEIAKGRPIYSDSSTLLRQAIEAKRREWFCSGVDCEPYDHGRDEGLQLALDAFDTERDRQLASQIIITALDNKARAALSPKSEKQDG
jgi:hypothetical protein